MPATPTVEVSSRLSGGYCVGRPRGVCLTTGRAIEPGTPYVAALRETGEGVMERVEFTAEAWDAWDDDEKVPLLAHWHTTMPAADAAKRKLLVDDDVLLELFKRLGEASDADGAATAERLAFRFVLGLILMRKKLLTFDRADADARGRSAWVLKRRKVADPEQREHWLVDPKLDESRLDEVGRQVGQILNDGLDADALADGGEA